MEENKLTWKNLIIGFNKCQRENQTFKVTLKSQRDENTRISKFNMTMEILTTILNKSGKQALLVGLDTKLGKPTEDTETVDALYKWKQLYLHKQGEKNTLVQLNTEPLS